MKKPGYVMNPSTSYNNIEVLRHLKFEAFRENTLGYTSFGG